MLSNDQRQQIAAVASMSFHPGSYQYLIECPDGFPCLSHTAVNVIHKFEHAMV